MKFIHVPTEADADVIVGCGGTGPDGKMQVTLSDGSSGRVSAITYVPRVGDYLVTKANRFKIVVPKDEFEADYQPAG